VHFLNNYLNYYKRLKIIIIINNVNKKKVNKKNIKKF